jgi:hypothetical protein
MTVRRGIAEPRRETSARSPEDPMRTRAVREGSEGEPAGRQVRRHRACEVEHPLYDPGAEKDYRNGF